MTDTKNLIPTKEVDPMLQRLQHNYRRIQKMQFLRSKNISYGKDIKNFRNDFVIDDQDANDWLDKFEGKVKSCSCRAVGAINANDKGGNIAIKQVYTCSHRLCNVCNAMRARLLRRKFFSFFEDEQKILAVGEKFAHFFPNLENVKPILDDKGNISGADIANNFSFMHLTLTVPHNNGLWNGKQYYAKELLQMFNKMRKCDWWKNTVFAGEQTVETTNTENGLHIHIHALLLVRKDCKRSRNFLFGKIFSKWNELTIDKTIAKTDLKTNDPKRYVAIKNVLMCIQDNKDFFKILNNIDARGSTMIDLKSLYKQITASQYNALKFGKFEQNGKYFKYIKENNVKDLVKGVTECLKYHFEPAALENEEGTLDVPFLLKILPNVYRQRLFGKFGFFFKVKALNINEEKVDAAGALQDFTDTAQQDSYCPITGESCHSSELQFVIVDIKHLIFAGNKKNYYVPLKYIKHQFPPNINIKTAINEFMFLVTQPRVNQTMNDANICLN